MTAPIQPDLFSAVTDAYLARGQMPNAALYAAVAATAGIPAEAMRERVLVGEAQQPHNLIKRAVRWHQQTLKHMGVIERDPSERGAWRLAERNKAGLHDAGPRNRLVAFSTTLGVAIWGRCETVLAGLDQPITLAVSSPPYLLRKARAYGGTDDEHAYVDFITRALEPIVAHLAPGGSICLNLTNDSFVPGSPARSLYRERLLIRLCDRFGLHRMDTL